MDTVREEGKVGLGKGENLKNTALTVKIVKYVNVWQRQASKGFSTAAQ